MAAGQAAGTGVGADEDDGFVIIGSSWKSKEFADRHHQGQFLREIFPEQGAFGTCNDHKLINFKIKSSLSQNGVRPIMAYGAYRAYRASFETVIELYGRLTPMAIC